MGEAAAADDDVRLRPLAAALEVSCRVMAFGLLGVAVAVLTYWVPVVFWFGTWLTDVDMATLEARSTVLALESPVSRDMGLIGGHLFRAVSTTPGRVYHAVALVLYFRLSRMQVFIVTTTVIVLYIAGTIASVFKPTITPLLFMLPAAGAIVVLWILLPRGNTFTRIGALQLLAFLTTVMFTYMLSWFPPTTDQRKMIFACVLFPAAREFLFGVVRYTGRKLALKWGLGGPGVEIRRDFAWMFLLWCQLGIAMVTRLFFSSFKSRTGLMVVVVVQSVVETTSRLTMNFRDSKMKQMYTNLRNGSSAQKNFKLESDVSSRTRSRRSPSVLVLPMGIVADAESEIARAESQAQGDTSVLGNPPSMAATNWVSTIAHGQSVAASSSTRERVVTTQGQFQIAHASFSSVVILGEMLSEYVGIFLVPCLLLLFENQRLSMPFDYYASLSEPFADEPLDRKELAIATMIQLLSELGVDTLCCFVEHRQGYRLLPMWKSRTRWLLLQLGLAAVTASSGVYAYVALLDGLDSEQCYGKDMCNPECRAGLISGGLRSNYCLYLNSTTP